MVAVLEVGGAILDGVLFGLVYAGRHNLWVTWATHYAADVVGVIALVPVLRVLERASTPATSPREDDMTIDWQTVSPVIVGVVTVLLMWLDWLLTTLQEREMVGHYAAHYQSYPIDTVEGNPLLQKSVKQARVVEPRHIVVALVLGLSAGYVSTILDGPSRELFIGYVWGLFLIVGTTHLSNLIGYRASRQGLHGKLYLHQRTGLLVQMGRYAATSVFVTLLAIAAASIFVAGVALAGATSSLRQLLWLRRVPPISPHDPAPRDLSATPPLPTS